MVEERLLNLEEEQARELLLEYKESTGKTQTDIAKALGVSDPQVSQFLNGTYKAPHKIIPKIYELVNINIKKEIAPKEPAFKMTTVSKTVMDLITYCHVQGKIGVIYGDAGIGKTMAIKEYKKLNSGAVVITISPCFSNITGVNELIADQLKIKEKTSRRVYSEAIAKLKGSNKVLIVDEAQHLTTKVINHLRCLSDESGIGIAFIGNEEIYLKMKGSGRASYAQLYSRIGKNKHVLTGDITRKDIEAVFDEDGCLEDDAIEILLKISQTNYGLRGAVNVFVNTAAVFKEVTAQSLARMAREMNIS